MRRQEEKYFVDGYGLSRALRAFNCFPLYPSRGINSLYFDTSDLQCFHDSEEGSVPRTKCRYRWYGDRDQLGVAGAIEVKTTEVHYRGKVSKRVEIANCSDLTRVVTEFFGRALEPVCQVSYRRLYYGNNTGMRITFDEMITYKKWGSTAFISSEKSVMEIKYSSEVQDHQYANVLGSVKTRFSKYNEAVAKLHIAA